VKLFSGRFARQCGPVKKIWPILLLLAGCGSKNAADSNDAAGALPPELTPNMAAVDANKAAQVQALIDKGLPAVLPDARSAQYRNVRPGGAGSACGEVSGKSTHGFVPFVVSPDGIAVVGKSAKIAYEDPNDFLADAWIRWCATPEELKNVAAAVQKAKPDALPANFSLPPDVPPPAAAAEPAAKPTKPPPPPQIGSFFNSVARGK
jgi:hypothetical protein